jgi:hypothetical protein
LVALPVGVKIVRLSVKQLRGLSAGFMADQVAKPSYCRMTVLTLSFLISILVYSHFG